ncbi:F-box only protein 5 isoform X2 [Bos mutus]|uniref:F-box protein 5 n=1 Tax=Bos mutus grunniens TaxID=30521 RepID=A0A8B9WIM4_BOSMU
MSRRPCSCSLRPLSGSCRCSYGTLTAAGRPCPSDGCKEESSTLSVKMKCDFNYNHVHSGIKPVKPDDSRRKGSYTTAYLEGSYKDCIKDYDRVSDVGSPVVSPRIVELEPESKPLHNKENQHIQQTLDSSNNIQELETSGCYEDSGYSSFSQRSGLSEHEDSSLALVESFNDSPQCCLLQTQSPDQYPNKNLLPALHFEKVVCSTLKKNCKRNPKIDWEKLKEFISSGNFRLQNIIGRKMGLECVDILSELFRRGLKHLLANILTQLSEMDLINVSKVSTTWKKILEDDKVALQLYNKAIQRITVAKTLKKNESLKACIRCNSPAKYDCYLQRATCKRESCGFDYCTKCLCTYHTSEDCSNGKPLKASYKMGPVPGTKKSKKNLRRL